MTGYDKDNIPSDITSGITIGSNAGTLLQPPMVNEITAVTTPTNDNTPSYTFKSSKSGTITYGGSCTSSTTSATVGNITINFNTLLDGTYSDCTLYVTSNTGVKGETLSVTPFTVDTTAPTVTFSPANGSTGVAITDNIIITFSEALRNIDNTELTDINIDSLNLITLVYSSAGNLAIDFDATINDNKTIITINPTDIDLDDPEVTHLVKSQSVNVAIGDTVEDYVGHRITASDATFDTQ